MNIELLGLFATVMIVCSFLFNEVKWIRILNGIGSILFVIYGICIGAVSVYVLNSICFCIQIYKLIRKK